MKTCNYNFEFGEKKNITSFMLSQGVTTVSVLETAEGSRYAYSPCGKMSVLMATTVWGLDQTVDVVLVTNKLFRHYPEQFYMVVCGVHRPSPSAKTYKISDMILNRHHYGKKRNAAKARQAEYMKQLELAEKVLLANLLASAESNPKSKKR
jgi:hypothetical protein